MTIHYDETTWNHRVMYHGERDGHPYYVIHEVYYKEDGSVSTWTENPDGGRVEARV
jgi:hypothetical protein